MDTTNYRNQLHGGRFLMKLMFPPLAKHFPYFMESDLSLPFPKQFTTRTQPEPDKSSFYVTPVHFIVHAWTKHKQILSFEVLTKPSLSFPVFHMQVSQASHALGVCTMCNSARYLLNKARVYFLQNSITWLYPEIILHSNTYVFIVGVTASSYIPHSPPLKREREVGMKINGFVKSNHPVLHSDTFKYYSIPTRTTQIITILIRIRDCNRKT